MCWLIRFFVLFACATAALAQTYPGRSIKVIVPWPPGQATDLAARLVAQKISDPLGKPLVVDNMPGAGGMLGSDAASKAAPDGYTLLAGSSGPLSINPILQTAPYDTFKSFAPVSMIGTVSYVLVASPSLGPANIKDLIALVKANPGKYSFASSGTGATGHLIGELFNHNAGLQVVHVPYKGAGPALTDVMAGRVAYAFETFAAVVGHVKSGRLKAYGVSSAERNAALPDVPTVADAADMPGFDMLAWIGYMAPAGTPRAAIDRLSSEIRKVMQAADLRERYLALGIDPVASTPEELAAVLKSQDARYRSIISKANIKLEQ